MKHWRPQFSIRSLRLLMVIVGLSVGWFIDHRTQSREIRLQASDLRRMEGRFDRVTNVLERFKEVLSRRRIEFNYDLHRIRFSLESNDANKRITNLSG